MMNEVCFCMAQCLKQSIANDVHCRFYFVKCSFWNVNVHWIPLGTDEKKTIIENSLSIRCFFFFSNAHNHHSMHIAKMHIAFCCRCFFVVAFKFLLSLFEVNCSLEIVEVFYILHSPPLPFLVYLHSSYYHQFLLVPLVSSMRSLSSMRRTFYEGNFPNENKTSS